MLKGSARMIGLNLKKWIQLLFQNRFRMYILYIPKAIIVTASILLLSPLVIYEKLRFTKKIKNTKITKSPIFIIGHWRTGTTFLHSLMTQDDCLDYLTLAELVFPNIILGSSKLIHSVLKPFIPKRRKTDKVLMSTMMPHEHEYGLMHLTLLSPYTGSFFPRNINHYLKYTSFKDATEQEREEWKNALVYLLRKKTYQNGGKQLVLKSPFDTARIEIILETFPDAKFIHIYRNPYEVFFSTLRMHNTNKKYYLLQKPRLDIKEFILNFFLMLYDNFLNDLHLIPEGNIVEVKYENLANNPIKELSKVYNTLSLNGFPHLNDKIHSYLDSISKHKVHKYNIPLADKEIIYIYWHEMIDRWNYEKIQKTKQLQAILTTKTD